ncbi:glycosyltransferase family 2 protein [Paenibacillaceae bacterium WGS1546]|uniref:glycosyltransferase family 2 protein n=1 Tax=Cohnella sp. WGS1546 TaxID=3366810 RepID=UPI00372CF575
MKLSVIIPSYNSEDLLIKGLKSLMNQDLKSPDSYEVIVVDDGSNDGTREAVERAAERFRELHYAYLPRDERSCRSRARNTGLWKASGEIACFLDSGIIVPADYLSRVADYYRTHSLESVLLHNTYGLEVDSAQIDLESLDRLDLQDPSAYRQALKEPYWRDPRHSLFESDGFGGLQAPWFLGFSCAFAVSAEAARAVGGFDEAFLEWGTEDIEFSYRLHRSGLKFDHIRNLTVFHYPHPIVSTAAKAESNARNKRYMHAKYNRIETEMNAILSGGSFLFLMEKLYALRMDRIMEEPYPARDLDELNEAVLESADRSLLVGADGLETARRLKTTHLLASSEEQLELFEFAFPDREVAYLLGCLTPYEDDDFDAVVVTDWIRLMHPDIRQRMMRELTRIGRQVVWLHAELSGSKIDQIYHAHPLPEENLVGSPIGRFVAMEKVFHASMEEMLELIRPFERVRIHECHRAIKNGSDRRQ